MTITRPVMARAGLALAALVLALECAAAQAPVELANPGFEDGAPGAAPPGWGNPADSATPGGAQTSPYRVVLDTDNPREGHASARLAREGESAASPFGAMAQTVDAKPYRGRRVRLTGAVRAAAAQAAQVGLWLRVDREGGRLGFFDNMSGRPITDTQWADYSIEGDVAPDAERIVLGLLVVGDGTAWIDAVRLEELGPASPAASNIDPRAYLEQALALLRQTHINSGSADWDGIAASARATLGDAPLLSDAHDAIRDAIAELGERHTFLRLPPPPGTASQPGSAPPVAMPDVRMIDGGVGLVHLPPFLGTPEQAEQYAAALRDGLTGMDSRACGWIVDLRDNTGGNMWPMLRGLDPLLGTAPFGAFRSPSGDLTYWARVGETIAPVADPGDQPPAYTLRSADAPVAVLLGSRTGSSGEMVAIALTGRPGERSFGANTAGLSTANTTFPLADGSMLVITTHFARDRTGHEYTGPLAPDEQVEESTAEDAAVRWLNAQGHC